MGEEKCIQFSFVGKPERRYHMENRCTYWRIILKLVFKEIRWEDMDCSYLAVDRGKWKAVVNVIMNVRFA
jgi:hypothetical protein